MYTYSIQIQHTAYSIRYSIQLFSLRPYGIVVR